jgi:hypothetical protein
MRLLVCFVFIVLSVTAIAQQNQCAGYQLSPEASHAGPRKFNVIQIDYSHASSFVLVSDASGRKIGIGSDGKRVPAKMPHAFYEDGDEAVASTGLPPEKEPEEITIQYPQSGRYEVVVTSRSSAMQWLRITVHNCGKRWSKEIQIPPDKPGVVKRWVLLYDTSSAQDPQVLPRS